LSLPGRLRSAAWRILSDDARFRVEQPWRLSYAADIGSAGPAGDPVPQIIAQSERIDTDLRLADLLMSKSKFEVGLFLLELRGGDRSGPLL